MQSLLCTALDAIELKRNRWGGTGEQKTVVVLGVAIRGRI
jgi:hypothetical protein